MKTLSKSEWSVQSFSLLLSHPREVVKFVDGDNIDMAEGNQSKKAKFMDIDNFKVIHNLKQWQSIYGFSIHHEDLKLQLPRG